MRSIPSYIAPSLSSGKAPPASSLTVSPPRRSAPTPPQGQTCVDSIEEGAPPSLPPSPVEPSPSQEPALPRAAALPPLDRPEATPWGAKVAPGPNGTLLWEEEDPTDLDFPEHWSSEVFHLEGIPRPDDLPSEVRQEWTERLGLTPRDFFLTLFDTEKVKAGETTVCVDRGEDGIRSLDLEIDLDCPRTGQSIGRMDRTLIFPDDSPPEAYHRLFDLDREAQGLGISKDLLANSIKLYDRAGIGKVELTAALSVGGYAWAKYGFVPRAGNETRALFTTVGERLERFEGIPAPVRKVVRALLDQQDPKAVWAISDLDGVQVRRGDRMVPLGKALLLGTVWRGSLQLDDPQARARFDQYVRKTPHGQGEA